MEPAAGRREHLASWPRARVGIWAPKWSPPLNGESTRRLLDEQYDTQMPQWSPPVNGGSTARKIRAV